jgi:hypothetical protein
MSSFPLLCFLNFEFVLDSKSATSRSFPEAHAQLAVINLLVNIMLVNMTRIYRNTSNLSHRNASWYAIMV